MGLLGTTDKKDLAVNTKIPELARKFRDLRRKQKELENSRNQKRMRMANMKPGEKATAAREVANVEAALETLEKQKHQLKALMNEQMDLL